MARSILIYETIEAALAPYRDVLPETSPATKYAADPWALADDGLVKVWDPLVGQAVPFRPWDHQRALGEAWIDRDALAAGRPRWRNVHCEKSRQMGDTWLLAYLALWSLLYHPVPGFMQHQDLGEVDDGGSASTIDSFFGKIRFMYESLPRDVGRPTLKFRGGNDPHIINLARPEAYLVGDGATADPGRGGRYAWGVIDEAARIVASERGHASLTRAIPTGRVLLSTPLGHSGVFWRLRRDRPLGWTFLTHHWSLHPIYREGLHVAGQQPDTCSLCRGNVEGLAWSPSTMVAHRYPGKLTSPWYDEAIRDLTDTQVAQELDIDYESALPGRIWPEFSANVHVAAEPLMWDERLPTEFGWDYGVDVTAVVICQDHPSEYRVVGEVEVSEARPEEVAEAVRAEMVAAGVPEPLTQPSRTLRMLAVGDPAGEARAISTLRSVVADYRREGFRIVSAGRAIPVGQTVNAVRRLLRGSPKPLVVSPRCERFIEHMSFNRWPTDRHGERRPGATVAPLDDEHNHMPSAFRYLVHYKWPAPVEPVGAAVARATAAVSDVGSGRIVPDIYEGMVL